ncbi:ATP-binding cassette domain-containing protein [Sphaerisporangium sp. TRM90804]|uniref:ATP-binding cassette domain-containing protein n=1 Tax=Sphaerisporangium sp. TRM90804 TaxID=3031113 RepID=UPI00244D19A3|nr:ATP-binding cassette domain-containing protein [Sphaerisporangium sp. TRM90804]MDH2428405.1 ATP-binding cassette domain-containing protein [Sphaerisporangium sp. TRM90804]
MIQVRGVAKSFGTRTLWRDLSFTVERGRMLALTGPSGAGKSTLLNCLGLLESVDDGEILVDGVDVTEFRSGAARRFRRDTLGYLFQNYALIENATVRANLEVVVRPRPGRAARGTLETALERVGLEGRAAEKVYRLSGGEQQRVALARLLVKRPVIVVADEPTGALDARNTDMVVDVLRGMAAGGSAVVVATHDPTVEGACDKVLPL